MRSYFTICLLLVFSMGCGKGEGAETLSPEAHSALVENWYQARVASLKSPEGWLNLIGLFWLEEGENQMGSKAGTVIVLPSGMPEKLGSFFLKDSLVFFIPVQEGIVMEGEKLREKTIVSNFENGIGPQLAYESLRFNLIKRDKVIGLRLRDLEADAVSQFDGIERYPVDIDWRLEATFIPYDPVKMIDITNVLGQTTPNPSPGAIEFELSGSTYRLDALDGGEEDLFLIFADGTSGEETYGGGRYIYIKKPSASGKTVLDFNMAYNPPCVFTPHATCPLPPRQNVLDITITAGEKNYGRH
ncbi:DUF1684 domain-containing protein [Rhodonellum sp.]|uniref:DUF1684 domain-containing protein n=1 Tax=Rhodonellum sp. TaxID=2231180 RepID=UPI00271954E5|nr:DUF1684 domain-containing protein [Rhodonellum sp.]MDO9552895.1 DUF1684 domain-containing protein [Rhodonellum sp.]